MFFGDVQFIDTNERVVTFQIYGVKFMGLNGGDRYSPSPAVSYFVYCGNDEKKILNLYESLRVGGKVLMPLDTYDWSVKYAWVEDKYGVSWQLDIDAINNVQSIVPAFLFTNEKQSRVAEAVDFYTTIFSNSTKLMEYPSSGQPLIFAQFKLDHYIFNAMSGGEEKHDFDFTEGNSFVIECETQFEIDTYWNAFSKEGKESKCGWVRDRYGVWWQIIPSILKDLMKDPATNSSASSCMMSMGKFDIAALQKAVSNS